MRKLIYILVLLAAVLPFVSSAQGWENVYDGGQIEETRAADLTLDGGVIVAGIQSDIMFPEIIYSFLYKTDMEGNLVWEFYDTLSNGPFLEFHDVKSTSDGHYLISTDTETGPLVKKISEDGTTVWAHDFLDALEYDHIEDITETENGDYLMLGILYAGDLSDLALLRVDADGNVLWTKILSFPIDTHLLPGEVIESMNGEIMVVGYNRFFDTYLDALVWKFSAEGDLIWENEYDDNSDQHHAFTIVEMSNGDFVLGGLNDLDPTLSNQFVPTLRRIDADGNQLWFNTYPNNAQETTNWMSMERTDDDQIVLAGTSVFFSQSARDYYIMKCDADDGSEIWTNRFGFDNMEFLYEVLNAPDDGYYLAGHTRPPSGNSDVYVVKTDGQGNTYSNAIAGTVFYDENVSCDLDSAEIGLNQWIVNATDGNISYFTLTDSLGAYSLSLDTGTYEVTVYPITTYWEFCESPITIEVGVFDTITQDFAAQAIYECPLLDISIGSPFLRRCFDNTYTVQYCNYGTVTAEDAYIEIVLDPFMTFQSSSILLESQIEDTLTFNIGEVEVGACESFEIVVLLEVEGEPCDSLAFGSTHCIEAHVYPDSICLPSNNWSGASVEVDALCQADSITFYITNVGSASTQAALEYIVIEDDVILFEGNYDLGIGEMIPVTVATDGSTFRLEAEQEPNHPGMSMPSISVEGCGTEEVDFEFGFVNFFAQDDGDPFVDIDCQENIGAYDPNDKAGFPIGLGEEKFIDRGQEIDYLIRFQNTGTDTAFNVVIEDNISDLLNIASIRPGASSHPYSFDINLDGVVRFNFENIMLPDSNVNEVASHGFVKFKIAQQPDLDIGTQIFNTAGIYFDFNAPIYTNTTLHTIGENYLETAIIDPAFQSFANVKIYPNPFSAFTNIEVSGLDLKNGQFKLYDVTGRLIRDETISGNTHVLYKKGLHSGMYFYTIEHDGALLASGKLISQ